MLCCPGGFCTSPSACAPRRFCGLRTASLCVIACPGRVSRSGTKWSGEAPTLSIVSDGMGTLCTWRCCDGIGWEGVGAVWKLERTGCTDRPGADALRGSAVGNGDKSKKVLLTERMHGSWVGRKERTECHSVDSVHPSRLNVSMRSYH